MRNNPNLTLIHGDQATRRETVSGRFPNLDRAEVAWVVDNFDMIADCPVFEYDMGGRAHRVSVHSRKVHLPEPLRIEGTLLSIPRDDPGRVNIIYSLDYTPTVIVGAPPPARRNVVRMASVQDPEFRARRRADRLGEALSDMPTPRQGAVG